MLVTLSSRKTNKKRGPNARPNLRESARGLVASGRPPGGTCTFYSLDVATTQAASAVRTAVRARRALESTTIPERRARAMGMIESEDRATSDPQARKGVLEQMEKEGVDYLLLWFTDIEGHLKSFAITLDE